MLNNWILWSVITGLIYWKHRAGLKALPDHLKWELHNDYLFPMCFIPRTLTSSLFFQPPELIIGSKYLEWTEKLYKSIIDPQVGIRLKGVDPCQHMIWAWALTGPLHFTITFPWFKGKGLYLRIGVRWDTIDDYYNLFGFIMRTVDLLPERKTVIYYRGEARV